MERKEKLNTWGATCTSMVAYLMPVVGIVLGAVIAREAVDLRVLAGTAGSPWSTRAADSGRSSVAWPPRAASRCNEDHDRLQLQHH
jgi:hypothetical protein